MDVGRRAAFDARAWPATLREDIFPGHTQYFGVGRTGGLDVHEAGRDAGDCFVALERRLGVPLRPERRGRMSARRRTRRMVTADHCEVLGCGRRDRGRHGGCHEAARPAERGAPLDRARRRPALDPDPRRRARRAPDAGRAPLDRPSRRQPRPSRSSTRTRGTMRPPPICSPASWPPTPGSNRASGPPRPGVLAAYRTASAMASTTIPPLDFDAFCSGPNTLYLCSAGPAPTPVRAARGRDHRRRARRRLRPSSRRPRRPAHPARPRRGRQHRPRPRPAGHGQRGGRPGTAGARLPAGSLAGPGTLGAGGRRLPLAVRHDRRAPRHRGHGDTARPECARR